MFNKDLIEGQYYQIFDKIYYIIFDEIIYKECLINFYFLNKK